MVGGLDKDLRNELKEQIENSIIQKFKDRKLFCDTNEKKEETQFDSCLSILEDPEMPCFTTVND